MGPRKEGDRERSQGKCRCLVILISTGAKCVDFVETRRPHIRGPHSVSSVGNSVPCDNQLPNMVKCSLLPSVDI